MAQYTTHILTGYQVDELVSWFDNAIGTEYEVDKTEGGFTVTFFELEGNEPAKIRNREKKILSTYEGA